MRDLKNIIVFFSLIWGMNTSAQQSINTAGGESVGTGHASYSIGQVSYTAIDNLGSENLIQGVQVPFEFFINTCSAAMEITPSLFGTPSWDTIPVPGTTYSTAANLGDASDDTWYYFTAESANDYIVAQSANGSFDAVIEFYDVCAGNSLGTYNNYTEGAIERVLPGGLTPGTEYHFRVYDPEPGLPGASDVRVQVKTFAKAGIRDQYCDVLDFALDDIISPKRQDLSELYPYTNVSARGYGIRLIDQLDQDTAEVYQTGIPSWYFSMNSFSNSELNHSYDATARHMLRLNANGSMGSYWSDWGPACTIGIGGASSTRVRTQYCDNVVGYNLDAQILAEYVPFATAYRFIFDDGEVTLIEENSGYGLFLYELVADGIQMNTSYDVTVQARVNGVWSDPGASCTIHLESQPEMIGVQAAYCNGTYEYPNNPNYLLAQYIYGAEAYEWRATPVGGGIAQTAITSGISLQMHTTTIDFSSGGQWDIEVRALAGGIWGDFGASCPITLNSTVPELIDNEGLSDRTLEAKVVHRNITLYPNPNSGTEFILSIEDVDRGNVTISIFDLSAKEVFESSYAVKGEEASLLIELDHALKPGAYLVIIQIGAEQYMEKMFVD